MGKTVKWGGELLTLLITAASWGLELYGQTIAGHEVEWKWIAAASGTILLILVVLHIYGLNSELWDLKDKRVAVRAEFDPVTMYDRVERWFRIGVRNLNKKMPAEDVEVKLEGIDPLPPDFRTIELPCRIGRKDAPEDRRKDEVIRIRPGDRELFDLVQHLGNNTIRIYTTVFQQRVRLNDAHPYLFKIRITVGNPGDRMQAGGRVEQFVVKLNGGELEMYHASEIDPV
jgi:hypothetical protein